MNPKKKQSDERAARRKAVKRSNKSDTQEWKGTDPAVRDAKKKIQNLFKTTLNGN